MKNYSEQAEQNISEANMFTTPSTAFSTSCTDEEYPIKIYRGVRQMSWQLSKRMQCSPGKETEVIGHYICTKVKDENCRKRLHFEVSNFPSSKESSANSSPCTGNVHMYIYWVW